MQFKRTVVAGLIAASFACAQAVDLTPASLRAMRRTSTASDAVKAQVDKLLADTTGDSRRKLAQSYALLKGETWNPEKEYAMSLALRPDAIVADPALPWVARLTQTYSAQYKTTGSLKLRLSLLKDGKTIRAIGAFDLPARDFIEQPFGVDADLDGVADGSYTASAEIMEGDKVVATAASPLWVVKGITLDRPSIDRRLAKIQGHDSTKASIRYPYVLAQTVNVGRRQFSEADFGAPDKPRPPYDFLAGVKTSAGLLKQLEAGKDPLFRAKGDHERAYWFEDAREMMAYRVYAPLKWDGRSKLPLVFVLHGNTRDQDYYFDRDDRLLSKLAEQHGYLVVCPMGYRPSAGWNSSSLNPGRGGSRQSELSEKDAMNVLDLVTKEYPVDPARTYLFGHSAGGAGTWYIGQKYPEKWAAIAASAAPTRAETFPFDRLKGMPIMICHGDQDDQVPVQNSRNMLKAAKEHGLDPVYVEKPGGTHITIVSLVEPQVFDFFAQHHK